MRHHKVIGVSLCLALIVGLSGWWVSQNYFQIGKQNTLKIGQPVVVNQPSQLQQSGSLTPTATPFNASPTQPVAYTVQSVVSGLQVPWSLVFTSPQRFLITERPGRIRVVENGKLLTDPIRVFPEVSHTSEEGLMGMTLDPEYDKNKYIYVCLAYQNGNKAADKVVRVTDRGHTLDQDLVLMDDIPAARFHAGCRIRFGPDQKLYISTGDATDKKLPQDLSSVAGKILRINADGTIPSDNPIANSPVFSYGHRNPQGFDWHPVTGSLIATEHGPSGIDGPGGGDEVNWIQPGLNYGWPIVSHQNSQPGMVDPLLIFTPAIAPASGMFYRSQVFPQLTNTFLVGLLRGEGIMQVVFDTTEPGRVLTYQKLPGIEVGRVRDIVEGPDGLIYFTTSNQDGRGQPQANDDQVYRLLPITDKKLL